MGGAVQIIHLLSSPSKFYSGSTFHSLVKPQPYAVDLSIIAMCKFIGIDLSFGTTHSVCGVRRVGNLGFKGTLA